MRPPLNAGENDLRHRATPIRALGFNEAPAERGGEQAELEALGIDA